MTEENNNNFLALYCCVILPVAITSLVFLIKSTIAYNNIENFECDYPLDIFLIISWVIFGISLIFGFLPKDMCYDIKKLYEIILTPFGFIYSVIVLFYIFDTETCDQDFLNNYKIYCIISVIIGGGITLIYTCQCIVCSFGGTGECLTISDIV